VSTFISKKPVNRDNRNNANYPVKYSILCIYKNAKHSYAGNYNLKDKKQSFSPFKFHGK